jgi:hypothetical protein
MRSIATFAAAAMLAGAAITADAQPSRPFRDAWFWGVSGGAISYAGADVTAPGNGSTSVAPSIGLDWLITRTTGGLLVSFNQAFANTQGLIRNGPTAADTGFRVVDVKSIRRFNMLAMAFPGNYLRFHPYVGAGVSFWYLPDAVAGGTFTQQKQVDFAQSSVNDVKAALGPSFMAGAQYRLKALSVFGQASVSARAKDFLLANGHTLSYATEFGVRYNLGSSIER